MGEQPVTSRRNDGRECAFDWEIYKSRRTALQSLRKNRTLIDTVLETEDGDGYELVHSQVMSALGEKLSAYLSSQACFVDSYGGHRFRCNKYKLEGEAYWSRWPSGVRLVRLAHVNRYTLSVLVECAYSGYIRTDVASGGLWQVLGVAEHYEMQEVVRACCAFLAKNLNADNCVHFYHIGARHRHSLQRSAWHQIRANFKWVLAQSLQRANQFGAQWLVRASEAELAERDQLERRHNNLATMGLAHLEALLMHDRLLVDDEESVWQAIKLWCEYRVWERSDQLAGLLGCIRLGRLRSSSFSARFLWRDRLLVGSSAGQQQLAVLERNLRQLITGPTPPGRDGHGLWCAHWPRQVRPRVPGAVLLALGGWQQGQPSRLVEAYDSSCNLWFRTHLGLLGPLAYHGLEYLDGLLWVCGGTDGTEILNELHTLDPVRGLCLQRASMREARCYVSTAALDRNLYALGGHNGRQRMRSAERYHLDSGRWFPVGEMNVARSDASACAANQRIYIAGGLNEQLIESSVEFYSARDDAWTLVASMGCARTSFSLLLCGQHLLAIGGNDGQQRLDSVEQFSLADNRWSAHSQMRHRRSTFSAALLDRDRPVVVGGYNGHTPFNQVEAWDESTRSWTLLQRMHFDRSGLRAVVLRDLSSAPELTFLGSAGP